VCGVVQPSRSPGRAFGDVVMVLFLAAQACDGVFTYIGIDRFGARIEGNPLIAFYVGLFGAAAAVAGAKLLAVICATALHVHERHKTLAVLTVMYLVVALLPWSVTLARAPHTLAFLLTRHARASPGTRLNAVDVRRRRQRTLSGRSNRGGRCRPHVWKGWHPRARRSC